MPGVVTPRNKGGFSYLGRLARLLLLPVLVCGSASRCVFAPPVPDETTSAGELSIDREKISPLTGVVVQSQRVIDLVEKFDITEAIIRPPGSPRLYVSWWLGFDPKDPTYDARIVKPGEVPSYELVICDAKQLQSDVDETVTVLLEALISTSEDVGLFEGRTEPRAASDGSKIHFVQWTLVVSGPASGCQESSATASGTGPQ